MKNLEKLKKQYVEMLNNSKFENGVYHCEFDVYDFGSKMLKLIEDEERKNSELEPHSLFTQIKNYLGYDFLLTKVKDSFHFDSYDDDNETLEDILTGMFSISYE